MLNIDKHLSLTENLSNSVCLGGWHTELYLYLKYTSQYIGVLGYFLSILLDVGYRVRKRKLNKIGFVYYLYSLALGCTSIPLMPLMLVVVNNTNTTCYINSISLFYNINIG